MYQSRHQPLDFIIISRNLMIKSFLETCCSGCNEPTASESIFGFCGEPLTSIGGVALPLPDLLNFQQMLLHQSPCPFSFGIQVAQFVRFKDGALKLQAKVFFFSISFNDFSICWKWFLLTRKLIALDKKFQKQLPLEDYFKQGPCMSQNDVDGVFNS